MIRTEKKYTNGDIFEIGGWVNGKVVYIENEGTFAFEYADEDGNIYTEPFRFFELDKMEVLGNKFDNSELLGE